VIEYAFDDVGGFIAVDHRNRVATYSFPSSPAADAARRRPQTVAKERIADMLATIRNPHSDAMAANVADMYRLMSRKILRYDYKTIPSE